MVNARSVGLEGLIEAGAEIASRKGISMDTIKDVGLEIVIEIFAEAVVEYLPQITDYVRKRYNDIGDGVQNYISRQFGSDGVIGSAYKTIKSYLGFDNVASKVSESAGNIVKSEKGPAKGFRKGLYDLFKGSGDYSRPALT